MQAIQVKTLPCTEKLPTRVKAWCASGSIIISTYWIPDNVNRHGFTAKALCEKLGWTGSLLSGDLPNGDTCFVFEPTSRRSQP